jgi:hypothetical protein
MLQLVPLQPGGVLRAHQLGGLGVVLRRRRAGAAGLRVVGRCNKFNPVQPIALLRLVSGDPTLEPSNVISWFLKPLLFSNGSQLVPLRRGAWPSRSSAPCGAPCCCCCWVGLHSLPGVSLVTWTHTGCHRLNRVLTHNNNNVVKSGGVQPYFWGGSCCSTTW